MRNKCSYRELSGCNLGVQDGLQFQQGCKAHVLVASLHTVPART